VILVFSSPVFVSGVRSPHVSKGSCDTYSM
jgi:hypothetical protein